MNNDLVPNLIDLYDIFTHLTSNNSALIHESTRMIASYLARNRKDAEEVLLSLSRFINSNIKSLSIPIIVKIISNILKTLSETNNISITHVTKTFFPLLISSHKNPQTIHPHIHHQNNLIHSFHTHVI